MVHHCHFTRLHPSTYTPLASVDLGESLLFASDTIEQDHSSSHSHPTASAAAAAARFADDMISASSVSSSSPSNQEDVISSVGSHHSTAAPLRSSTNTPPPYLYSVGPPPPPTSVLPKEVEDSLITRYMTRGRQPAAPVNQNPDRSLRVADLDTTFLGHNNDRIRAHTRPTSPPGAARSPDARFGNSTFPVHAHYQEREEWQYLRFPFGEQSCVAGTPGVGTLAVEAFLPHTHTIFKLTADTTL